MTVAPRRLVVGAAIAAVYVIWGSTYLGIRFALEGGFTPFLMGGIRFLVAGGVLYAIALRTGSTAPTLREWRGAAVVGALMLIGGVGLVSVSEDIGVGSGVVATAIAVMPLWAALWSGLYGSWPRRLEWVGLLVGFGGVALLSFEGDFSSSTTGLVLVITAPLLWALGSVISGRVAMPTGRMGTAAQMLAGGAMLTIGGFLRGEQIDTMPDAGAWLALLYLIVLGSIVTYSAYMFLLANVRPALATSYAYVNPVVAVILGITLGGEVITGWTLAGLPVILFGVAIVGIAQRGRGFRLRGVRNGQRKSAAR